MGGASQPASWVPKPGLEGKAVPQPGSQREGVRWPPAGAGGIADSTARSLLGVGRGTPEDACPLSFSHLGFLLTTGREAAVDLGTLGAPGCLSASKVTASLIPEVRAGAGTSAPGHPLLSPWWPACSSKASDAAAHPPAVRPRGRGWQGPS